MHCALCQKPYAKYLKALPDTDRKGREIMACRTCRTDRLGIAKWCKKHRVEYAPTEHCAKCTQEQIGSLFP